MKLELLDIESAETFGELKIMMKENEKRKMSIIGKALEEFDQESGVIDVFME